MSDALPPSSNPTLHKRRLRGCYLDENGVGHYVNAMILHVEQNDQLVDHTDAWETECIEHWWNETPPKMVGHKVTCIHCLALP